VAVVVGGPRIEHRLDRADPLRVEVEVAEERGAPGSAVVAEPFTAVIVRVQLDGLSIPGVFTLRQHLDRQRLEELLLELGRHLPIPRQLEAELTGEGPVEPRDATAFAADTRQLVDTRVSEDVDDRRAPFGERRDVPRGFGALGRRDGAGHTRSDLHHPSNMRVSLPQ
jgi:hypothetical protein